MRIFLSAALAALWLTSPVAPVLAQTSAPLPISEFGKLPDVERATISPSGDRIAVLTTLQGKRILMAIEDQNKVLMQVAVNDMKIRDLEWVDDERILLISSQTENLGIRWTTNKGEFFVGTIIPIREGVEGGVIFGNVPKLVNVLMGEYGIRDVKGVPYGFFGAMEMERTTGSRTGYELRSSRVSLYRVNLQNLSTKKVGGVTRPGMSRSWLIGADGEVAAYLDINQESGEWALTGSGSDPIASGTNPFGAVWIVGSNYDGSGVIFGERTAEDVTWTEVPLAGGAHTPFLDNLDIDRAYFDKRTGQIMGYLEGDGEDGSVTFNNPGHAATVEKVRKAFPNLNVRLIDWTSDLSDVIVRTRGNKDSGTYYAVDMEKLRANAFAYERLAIGPDRVGDISTFEYTASDGMKMDGILTLPPGKEAKNLPVIVLPHGGPHSHNTESFDWWAQAFASRGYAVFQPNFRGSTNRTVQFRMAGYGEWGRKMQTDKSDGLAALAEAGIVDPDRACIVGASYGGYSALAGVTLQKDIYRCAVAVAPVSDIRNMYAEDYRASGGDRTTKASLLEQLGPRDRWDAVSPLRAAGQASAPIMLIHGKDDTVVPYSHSTKMADKLKDNGKPYEMVTLDGEDHWLSLSKTRQLMLESSIRFVEKHNPPN